MMHPAKPAATDIEGISFSADGFLPVMYFSKPEVAGIGKEIKRTSSDREGNPPSLASCSDKRKHAGCTVLKSLIILSDSNITQRSD